MLGGLLAINQGDNVWMMQALQNGDLGGEVVLELFVEFGKVDRLDCDESLLFLLTLACISNMLLPRTTLMVLGRVHRCFLCRTCMDWLVRTYDVDCFVDSSEATSPDLFHLGETPNCVRFPRASRNRRLRCWSRHVERESPAHAKEAGLRVLALTIFSATDAVVNESYR